MADRPSEIPAPGWRDIFLRLYRKIVRDHVLVVAAGVAFFALFALFPAIGAVVAIAGYVLNPADVADILSGLADVLPPNAAAIVQNQLVALARTPKDASTLGAIIGILLALYGAMKGVKSLMEGLNIAYEEEEKRGFIHLNLFAFGLTLMLVVGVLLAVGVMIVVPLVAAFLALPPAVARLIGAAQWVLLALLTVWGLALVYRFGPSRAHARWRWISPGSVAATAMWLAGTAAFSVYAQNFANYNETYGAIGGVIALMMWLWLSALAVLLGAELDAEIEHQTVRDSTTGPEKPMGQRGAVKADTVPEGLPVPPGVTPAPPPEPRRRRSGTHGWISTAALAIAAIGTAFGGRRS